MGPGGCALHTQLVGKPEDDSGMFPSKPPSARVLILGSECALAAGLADVSPDRCTCPLPARTAGSSAESPFNSSNPANRGTRGPRGLTAEISLLTAPGAAVG